MSVSRLLPHATAHAVATVLAATTLLVLPAAPASSYAVPERCTVSPQQVCSTDSDGDGLPDTGDGCPTVAASNPTGCPSASRGATLTWLASAQRLEARISAPVVACSARARIVLWRVRPQNDVKVTSAAAAYSGKRRFVVPRGAGYYVTVSPSYSTGVAECGRATSRTVRVPRA